MSLDPRRALPGIDQLLERQDVQDWIRRFGREPVRGAFRTVLASIRDAGNSGGAVPSVQVILRQAHERLDSGSRASLTRVLNGTGVVLHTNLGRAPLPNAALAAVQEVARGYSNLEYDVDSGSRGSRYDHCVDLIREMTGAEDALVLNNNAAAVALTINEFALGREVVASRGELVEIGGSFRIPDIVTRAGATLREVGTTNRTRIADYRAGIGDKTGLLLKVHPANYSMSGFVSEVPLAELVSLSGETGIPLLHDLGSGLLRPEWLPGYPPEPTPGEAVRAGADLVTWSGDKLLGGPQAGILHGRKELVERLRKNPLLRAFRVGKMTLAALAATLRLYRDPVLAAGQVPALAMLREPAGSVRSRAAAALPEYFGPLSESGLAGPVELVGLTSLVGGGAFPDFQLDSFGWAVRGVSCEGMDRACRKSTPPLVGRIEAGSFVVDVRTLLPGEECEAAHVLRAAYDEMCGDE